jgi:hypothetical protein
MKTRPRAKLGPADRLAATEAFANVKTRKAGTAALVRVVGDDSPLVAETTGRSER